MRKIAIMAVTLVLSIFMVGAGTHVAGAQKAQHNPSNKPAAIAYKTTADVTPAPASNPSMVTVQSGDTLSGIAADNGTTYGRLFDANSFIADPNLIYPGDQVRIPTADEQLADRSAPSPTVVTVQAGDTLDGIAAANGTTTQRLFDANANISDQNTIYPGDQVRIPASDEQLTDRAMPTAAPATDMASDTQATDTTAAATTVAATTTDATSGVPDNAAKAYIYQHESSNNPDATNWLGCYGLGQDCNGLLKPLCGANYACQDAFFDNYAQQRYGGWANAQAFWVANHWW